MWRGATHKDALALALISAMWIAAIGGGAARANAETLVNFDNLAPNEAVTDQYEAQGLKLGFAQDFGQV